MKRKKSGSADAKVGKKTAGFSRKPLIIAGIVLAVIAAVYVGTSFYFMSHFFLRTRVNGMNVSGYSTSHVRKKAAEGVKAYTLKISDESGEYDISGADIDLQADWDESIDALVAEQNGFLWPSGLAGDKSLKVEGGITYNEQKLQDILSNEEFMNEESRTPSVNATISDYSSKDGYTVVPQQIGTVVDASKLLASVDSAIHALRESVSLAEENCFADAEVTEEDETLNETVEKLNKWAQSVITYEVDPQKEVLDASVFSDWIKVSDDMKLSIDKEKAAAYVASLANKYDTYQSAKKLKTSWGPTIEITNSHYGWKLDQEAECAQIIKEIKKGKSISREMNFSMTANSHGENDYGDSYVEVNLTAQHMLLHVDGEIVIDSDCVTGNARRGDNTPCGAFTLTYKDYDANLRGPGYSSHVDYWMPFYGNYGMHDASWRSAFGGSIYKTRGSHGCVNLPIPVAKTVFGYVDKGFPVLIYELEGSTAQNIAAMEEKDLTVAAQADGEKPEADAGEKADEKTEEKTSEADEKKDTVDEKTKAVISAIDSAVGGSASKVTLDAAKKIAAARKLYNALKDDQKTKVSNYKKLTEAESAIKKLREKEEKASEKKESDKKASEKSEKKASEKKESDQKASEKKASEKKASDKKKSDQKTSDKKTTTDKSSDKSSSGTSKSDNSSETKSTDTGSSAAEGGTDAGSSESTAAPGADIQTETAADPAASTDPAATDPAAADPAAQ